ncbi:MAG TPA: NHL repeat-containing protein [Dehalococcoidia bacterium]|nr:NHL repeat-containing protein [Dehalococcoidia bacterium]
MVRPAATGQAPEAGATLSPRRRVDLLAAVVLACAVISAALAVALIPRDVPGPELSARVYPARLARHLGNPSAHVQPSGGAWNQPSDIVALGERWFVLDTGNNRILELNGDGAVLQVLDQQRDGRLALRGAMALAGDGRYLYVANSGAAQVLVLTPEGGVVGTFPVGGVEGEDSSPARPIGLAVAGNGDFLVSDADNHRVLRYDREGRLLWAAGSGRRAGGEEGFNTPAGLALDQAGNVYVVDILNGRVVKLAPDGTFLGQYGRLGDTAGTLARPKDVAIDAAGNVYVSDGLLAAVQVFGPTGEYRGFIGLKDPADRGSGALFRAPAGLTIAGPNLYVVDRFASVFVMDLPGEE